MQFSKPESVMNMDTRGLSTKSLSAVSNSDIFFPLFLDSVVSFLLIFFFVADELHMKNECEYQVQVA